MYFELLLLERFFHILGKAMEVTFGFSYYHVTVTVSGIGHSHRPTPLHTATLLRRRSMSRDVAGAA